MKRITWTLLIALLFVLSDIASSHEITQWKDNRSAAVSVTFDDGWYSQPTEANDLLNARNIKGTFFLTIDSLEWAGTTWDMWRNVAANGHEIGSHSVTHPYLTQLSEMVLREELSDSQEVINLNITTKSCLTLAYPYGDYNDFVKEISSEYYIAGREVWSPGYLNHYPGGTFDPVDFFAIGSFNFNSNTHEQIFSYLDSAEEHNAWFVVHIHDIDPEVYQDSHSRLVAFFDELLVRDIWVDTLGTIVRYMQENIYSTLDVISERDNEIILNLTHSLDNDIYNIALTIRSTVPSSWSEVEIVQGGSINTIEPVIENDETVIYFNVIPNAGMITLSHSGSIPSPKISLSPTSLSPSSTQGSNAPDQTFDVWNSGSGVLDYSISVNETWLSCNPESGTSAGEQDTITVSYSTSSLAPGTYEATITLTDPDADNSPQTIPVSLTVTMALQPIIFLLLLP